MASLVSRSQNGLPFSIKCDKLVIVHLSIIMSTHKTLFLLCALGLAGTPFLSLKASENRWPAFRGPDRQGHSLATNVPIEWETKGKIGWKVPLSLSGWASPVVDQGHVIVSGSREEAGSITLHVASYRLADGTLEWETKVFELTHRPSRHAIPRTATPAVRPFSPTKRSMPILDTSAPVPWT